MDTILEAVVTLIQSGGMMAVWVAIVFLLGKYVTPLATAGIVLRGIRLIIREIAEYKKSIND